jgi:PAS domain S-box-containing protein
LRLIRSVAPRWYGHVNDATLASSGLLLAAYIGFEIISPATGSNIGIEVHPIVAIVSAINIIYAAVLYRAIAQSSVLAGAFISFLLFLVGISALIITTGSFESQFIGLWVIVALLGGMFGWPVLTTIWLSTNAYFSLILFGVVGETVNAERGLLYFIMIQLPFLMSYMIWRTQAGEQPKKNKPTKQLDSFSGDDVGSDMLIQSIAEGVVVIDAEDRIRLFNPAAQDITGWAQEDAVGIDYKLVLKMTTIKDADLPAVQDPIKQVVQKGESVINNDIVLRTKTNKKIEISMVASPLLGRDGAVEAVAGVFRDISQEKNEARQRAEFISTASHEMRTPVAAIEGYLALALNDRVSKIDSAARSYLDKAHSSTQHLGKLFQDLLTAAKSEDGRLANHPKVTDMGAFVEQIVEDVRFTAENKGLIVEADFGEAVGGGQVLKPIFYAHIDPDRMREVIINLFDNAVKYTEEGKITIGFRGDQESIVISVQDTGVGIPQEDVAHLFQKFYRVDNTATRQIGGTGLGLFIARKIVELYNGRIWVESETGKGSTFYISLPRLPQDKADQLMRQESSQSTPLSSVVKSAKI